MNRRSFITSIIALAAAPAIVRVENLMPVRSGLVLPASVGGVDLTAAASLRGVIVRTAWNKLSTGGFIRVDYFRDGSKDFTYCDRARVPVPCTLPELSPDEAFTRPPARTRVLM